MQPTKQQIKLIVDQEINNVLDENMDRRQFCKLAAGTAAFFQLGCQEYELSHVTDDNTENMQLPECVQNVHFSDYDNAEAWPKPLESFKQEFEGKQYVEVFVSGNPASVGFDTVALNQQPGLIVKFHNIPAESPSLEDVLGMSDEEIESSYTGYDKTQRVLSTIFLCFPILENMVYLNHYNAGYFYRGQDEGLPWYEFSMRPQKLVKQDEYRRGELKQCYDAYEAYLFGPIRPEQQELP